MDPSRRELFAQACRKGTIRMVIKLQHIERRWHVVHPAKSAPIAFRSGATAFDFADALAREHYAETGDSSAVRVQVLETYVDAVRYG
jgi:hypothetical protein